MVTTMKLMLCLSAVTFLYSRISAFAQNVPAVQVSAGYNLLTRTDAIHVEGLYSRSLFSPFFIGGQNKSDNGWFAEVVGNATRHVGVVGQVSANYTTPMDSSFRYIENAAYTVLGGPRLSSRCCRAIVPFAEVLLGFVHSKADVTVPQLQETRHFTNYFWGLAAGGGADVRLAGPLGLHFGADVMRTNRGSAAVNADTPFAQPAKNFEWTPRFRAGLVVAIR